jgi:uncharacterized protein YfaS (alpha-2-macroglobulin family)
MKKWYILALLIGATLVSIFPLRGLSASPPESIEAMRTQAHQQYRDGNYADALAGYRQLLIETAGAVPQDLYMAVTCLQQLNRVDEFDALVEQVVQKYSTDWQMLQAAAERYQSINHYGMLIGNEFSRGGHRGGGQYINVFQRDRVRALQLMLDGMSLLQEDSQASPSARANFYSFFAQAVFAGSSHAQAWRLQYLTDLETLPEYDLPDTYGSGARGAPVTVEGQPVFYAIPASFEAAASDGERWRWLQLQAMESDPSQASRIRFEYADFLLSQFGVQTLQSYGAYLRDTGDTTEKQAGIFTLHTLEENETIAQLATGISRFQLPDEHNSIRIFHSIAAGTDNYYAQQALERLANIFANRRQYEKAADCWRQVIERFGPGHNDYRLKQLEQIVGNWGQFEPVMTHPAGRGVTLDFRFRNASSVSFEAYAVDVRALLEDVKNYIKSNPRQLDWQKVQIDNIGYRLVQQNERKYLGDKVADWTLALEPRPHHFDRLITVQTPLRKAGAYLLIAQLPDGNTSRIIVWINDTVIARKPLNGKTYIYLADAVSGQPVAKANVEFFGYRQDYVERRGGRPHYDITTRSFAEFADRDGQAITGPDQVPTGYDWLITATTNDGRFAYLGFTGIWYPDYYDQEYEATKLYTITDRPVYRPGQAVNFKVWIRHAKYDQEDVSMFGGRAFTVIIRNPRGDTVLEKAFTADAYGGIDGQLQLEDEAQLGVYSLYIENYGGSGSFRVEEYKKPEFEVTVEAPAKPVMLGETITAEIKAKYYFGSPVVNAKVKYRVMRSSHSANWYPIGLWDWFYGRGYWWFACDYDWYPGWYKWGLPAPRGWWWPTPHTPPELVMENEVPIGEDGTVKIEIDTRAALELHGDTDHRYEITAEITDQSRRTIVGTGQVLVAREPFQVYAWVDRGHYRAGDVVQASFCAQTLDNRPVQGNGNLTLFSISYTADGKPIETAVASWDLDTDSEGRAQQKLVAAKAGQYRLAYNVTDSEDHTMEGGYIFCVLGEDFDGGADFRFNQIELIPDKKEYGPDETVKLLINTEQEGSTVLLFVRPANGVYLPPKALRIDGKSTLEEIVVTRKDMPNFFIEALTVSNGRIHSAVREIIVPPEQRVLNVEVLPSAEEYKPGAEATVDVKVTDFNGNPFSGSLVISMYDRAVEYISGGSNVPDIREFFWKWRRRHRPNTESNLDHWFTNLLRPKEIGMQMLGVFGHSVVMQDKGNGLERQANENGLGGGVFGGRREVRMRVYAMKSAAMPSAAAPMEMELAEGIAADADASFEFQDLSTIGGEAAAGGAMVEPTIRTRFADTAYWNAAIQTAPDGTARVTLTMPENLTGWKLRTWALGHGTKVGEGTAAVVTRKNLMLRLQAPRFFVEKDEVVLSANIHNYLADDKEVEAILELDGNCLEAIDQTRVLVTVPANGEHRVDWRVKAVREGEAVIRMKALTDEESDAMEMRFPVYVHGMDKMVAVSGVLRPEDASSAFTMTVPAERRVEETRLELRYSPTLAGAMVDALPYLVSYPYGCTEQTLNRFLPTVIVQKILLDMGLNLEDIREKQTNLNAQELGDAQERAGQWQRWNHNAVFDQDEVRKMVKEGLQRLTDMQLTDGGWGWFSGWGEQSYAHTTAVVVHGLQIARDNDAAIVPGVIERGVTWLQAYQQEQVRLLKNAASETRPWKRHADNLDALVFMVLVDADVTGPDMLEFLYRDRNELSVYAKAMFGIALAKQRQQDKLAMILQNIEQYLVMDDENQTAWLNLPNSGYWWYWYGSETEAHAYYLKLLAMTDPKGEKASRLVKYLLNNRKHATYWNSTRDTALAIEAMADYLRASGEDKPDMTVQVFVDGELRKEVRITPDNLFSFDNTFTLSGTAVSGGEHRIEIRRQGGGPLYYNAYLSYFTLEDYITKAGLEIKVERKIYLLVESEESVKAAGARGQALDQRVLDYDRVEVENLALLKSGDLIEIELVIESKNDYEYLVFEDPKAAGFEPVEVRSGYVGNALGAYMELRDERVAFFVRQLPRGRHSVTYRMRAEIPGRFSALPTRGYAMYAPELRANSEEIKLRIED